jgi:hypothetical protein
LLLALLLPTLIAFLRLLNLIVALPLPTLFALLRLASLFLPALFGSL